MPAGDLITGDYQAELQGFLMGDVDTLLGPGPISGLGSPRAKTEDVQLDGADGSYGSPDYLPTRAVGVPFQLLGDTAADVMILLDDANTAWEPVTTDVQLHIQLPGWGHFYYTGRPRELIPDLTLVADGVIFCLGTFDALSPSRVTAGS